MRAIWWDLNKHVNQSNKTAHSNVETERLIDDWKHLHNWETNKQRSDEQNRSGCVDVWIWVVGRSGSIPPPVAPDRQLVSVRLPPPPSLACPPRCLSAFSQYHPHSYKRRCSALPWSKFTFSSVALGQDRDQKEHSKLSDWDSLSFLKEMIIDQLFIDDVIRGGCRPNWTSKRW